LARQFDLNVDEAQNQSPEIACSSPKLIAKPPAAAHTGVAGG
jgi:hypothetical protein